MLNSKYPIIALWMNQVSDIPFAIACAKAGITASIGINDYVLGKSINYEKLVDDLIEFKKATGGMNLVVTLHATHIFKDELIQILYEAKVKILEVIFPWTDEELGSLEQTAEYLQALQHGFIVLQRMVHYDPEHPRGTRNGYWLNYMNGAIVKGDLGGGTVSTLSLPHMMTSLQEKYNKILVAAGGIHSKGQIDYWLNNGASAVGIGTLFALSKESKISLETKKAMMKAETLKHESYEGKNAVVFKPIETSDPNHTASLKLGIHKPELGGHVYCGAAAEHVNKILTLKTIVKNLVT